MSYPPRHPDREPERDRSLDTPPRHGSPDDALGLGLPSRPVPVRPLARFRRWSPGRATRRTAPPAGWPVPATARRRPPSRNVVVTVLALWLLVLASVGVGDARGREAGEVVTVLGPWTGAEAATFREVLADFTSDTGIRVDYQGTSAHREVLLADVQAGTMPDIAVLPSPGEVVEHASGGDLEPLDDVFGTDYWSAYDRQWVPRLHPGTHIYALPIKADLKSVVWYDTGRHTAAELPDLAWDGAQWCAGMGADATSGWPGTDWVEDILLQQRGTAVYQRWATGDLPWTDPRVARAWRTWGDIFRGDAARRALETYYADAGKGMFRATPRCAMEHQSSFIRGGYPDRAHPDFVFSADLLPGADRHSTAREVSGDFATLFRKTPQSQQLMRYLGSARTQTRWARRTRPGAPQPFFVNRDVPRSAQWADAVSGRIAGELRSAEDLCVDASDAMPPRMRAAFLKAVLEFLSDPEQEPQPLLERLEKVRRQVPADQWLPAVCG